ncbi:MAG: hypothetical protein ACK4GJ_02415 [bacterium]
MLEIKRASIEDKKNIKNLYFKVYGNFYSLPEVQDEELMEEILKDKDNLWIIATDKKEVIGSLLFRVSKELNLSKALAAVVLPEYRGKGIFKSMFEYGLKNITTDIIYALTRTVSPEPQKILLQFEFIPLGIFPNVRRIYAYENHGLYALFKENIFLQRKNLSKIIKEVEELLSILKDIIIQKYINHTLKGKNSVFAKLEDFISEKYEVIEREKFNFTAKEAQKIEIKVINVEKEYIEEKEKLRFKFFPFHKPNFKITTEFGSIFLHLNMIDKHSAIMGIRVPGDDLEKTYNLFFNIPYIVDKLDARYLEVISMANKYRNHSILLDNGFIPSAYFPCLVPEKEKRVDAVIFFYPHNLPHFKKMFVPDIFKPYIKYVYNMIVRKIKEEIESSLN